ncbi:MAG: peptidylprolyl isomerase [Proteobacteria bacterium]|nr:peptidylprolyl isomerase [Pseudomonadota bacterium]
MAEQITASHILVSTDGREPEAAKSQIEAIRDQIAGGADFADIARAKSDCPSGGQGGDLGSFGRGAMVAEFEAAAFALDVDAVSGIVETDFGYHLILRTA